MEAETQDRQEVFIEFEREPSNPAAPGVQLSDAEAAHSARNILQWMEYLPAECINAMIEMGWDVTT